VGSGFKSRGVHRENPPNQVEISGEEDFIVSGQG
jgi:hypothetical protein